jgi:superfamily II DNA or RNA helicase
MDQGWMSFMDGEVERKPKPYRPRPYQLTADERIYLALMDADRCGLYVATGCGKTEIIALLCKRDWSGKGILVITPRRELVGQTADRLVLRGVPCGIEMAEQRSDEKVTVACYASLQSRKRYRRFLGTVGLVVVDESHLNYSKSALDMLKEFREWGAKVVGMTASPPSKKDVSLSEHYGDPAFVYDYAQAVADGYLVGCKMHLCVLEDLDLSRFKASFGDFDQARLDKLLRQKSNVAGVGAMIEKYWDGQESVVFCASIAHAEAVRDDLISRGIQGSIIHSQMDAEEQRLHLRDFMEGTSKIILNVGILTLGWDAPNVRKLFVARCTASSQLYTQMFGRGTRTLPGVIDGIDTVEGRLAAIAASDKKWFEVYDITDSSRHNDLKTALDILRPTLDDRLMKRVRQRAVRQPMLAEEVDAVIEAERKAMAQEQAALDRIELQKRLHIQVGGTVTAYERDTFADAEGRPRSDRAVDFWWMPFGRFKGRGFKQIHAEAPWYLPYMIKNDRIKNENLARNIRKFLSNRGHSLSK